ncbi:potassium channel family protein [Halopelagius fulvigenes]|uniref:Potassium channel family protein n=1 Tax=Halopelagius fulvigenes TaxID=1198324 RepID=A0ABD5TSC9_9EURY
MSTQTLIVGGGHVGRLLAGQMDERRGTVRFVDDSETAVRRARENGVPAREATLTSLRSLDEVGVGDAETAIAVSLEDSVNMLVVQLLRCQFGVPRVIVLVNDPRNRDAFDELGVESICASTAITGAVLRTTLDPDTETSDGSPVEPMFDTNDGSEPDRSVARSFDLGSRLRSETLGTDRFAKSARNRIARLGGRRSN